MSKTSEFFFAALAASATFAGVQMAASEAISQPTLAERFEALAETAGATGIDRQAKTDRESGPARGVIAGRTVILPVDGLSNTSVIVRIPMEAEKETRNVPPPAGKPSDAKHAKMMACEPVVSALTDVAKLLQPGKCIA